MQVVDIWVKVGISDFCVLLFTYLIQFLVEFPFIHHA